jgi:hypothetical protein
MADRANIGRDHQPNNVPSTLHLVEDRRDLAVIHQRASKDRHRATGRRDRRTTPKNTADVASIIESVDPYAEAIERVFALRALPVHSLLRVANPVRAICPNCRTGGDVQRLDEFRVWPSVEADATIRRRAATRTSDEVATGPDYVLAQIWNCQFCTRPTVLFLFVDYPRGGSMEITEVRQVWPETQPRSLPGEAPESVQSLYREASLAENAGALRGAAAFIARPQRNSCGTAMRRISTVY